MNARILALILIAAQVPGFAAAEAKHKPRPSDRYMSATAPRAYPSVTPTPAPASDEPERGPFSSSANGS